MLQKKGRTFQQRKLGRETRSYAPKEPLSGSSLLGCISFGGEDLERAH